MEEKRKEKKEASLEAYNQAAMYKKSIGQEEMMTVRDNKTGKTTEVPKRMVEGMENKLKSL